MVWLKWLFLPITLLLCLNVPLPKGRLQGWAGPSLGEAKRLARETKRPILIFIRGESCHKCDKVEKLLTQDPEITFLASDYIRVLVRQGEEIGDHAAHLLGVKTIPTVLILGPRGNEALRGEEWVDRPWLLEQLQVILRRHRTDRIAPEPSTDQLLESLRQLEDWGDRSGADKVGRLLLEAGAEVEPGSQPAELSMAASVDSASDLEPLLFTTDEPGELRVLAFQVALGLEDHLPELALQALHIALDRLGIDPLTEARAGFLAVRHGLRLEETRTRLAETRQFAPDSVPVLLALARAAEKTRHLYQAFHALEAAAVYSPGNVWVALELQRIRLLIRLQRRKGERDPT